MPALNFRAAVGEIKGLRKSDYGCAQRTEDAPKGQQCVTELFIHVYTNNLVSMQQIYCKMTFSQSTQEHTACLKLTQSQAAGHRLLALHFLKTMVGSTKPPIIDFCQRLRIQPVPTVACLFLLLEGDLQ